MCLGLIEGVFSVRAVFAFFFNIVVKFKFFKFISDGFKLLCKVSFPGNQGMLDTLRNYVVAAVTEALSSPNFTFKFDPCFPDPC